MSEVSATAHPPILQINDLQVSFPSARGKLKILEGVTFSLYPGEILALVGETGCGKSVTAKSILNLIPQLGSDRQGTVSFGGHNLLSLSNAAMRHFRGRRISMIFQNPQASINPVFTLGEQIFRLIRMYLPDEIQSVRQRLNCGERQAVSAIARQKLEEVGLTDVEDLFRSYVHQISGGMAQRYRIATALLSAPEILIADEATSALDVTVQAHILKLLKSLCRRKGTAIVFITHDLGIAAQICDRVAVMYAGRIVELAPTLSIFQSPKHPYTQGLLGAVPRFGREEGLSSIPGMIPDLANPPRGCRFHPRCPHVVVDCKETKPASRHVGEQHRVACFLYPENGQSTDGRVIEGGSRD